MTIRTIEYLLGKFSSGKNPRSADYVDLIDSLADDRNAVYFSGTAPEDTGANPLWFNTSTNVLSVYDGEWVTAGGATGPIGATGPGVAVGGTSGQYLVKVDETNYNTAWSNPVQPIIPFISQQFYTGIGNRTLLSLTTPVNFTHYMPFYVPEDTTFDRIAVGTGTANISSAGAIRLGIYNNLGGKPNTVLLDAGTVALAAASTVCFITINQTLSRGLYWLAANITTPTTGGSIVALASNAAASFSLYGAPVGNLTIGLGGASVGWRQPINASAGFATAVSENLTLLSGAVGNALGSAFAVNLRKL